MRQEERLGERKAGKDKRRKEESNVHLEDEKNFDRCFYFISFTTLFDQSI
jgi:hypothetical protein